MTKLKILIAEDDPITLTLLEAMVNHWGYEVVSARDGESARELLRAGGVNICILDWNMPKLSGRDLCQWAREMDLKPQPYIILLTAKDQPENICQGFAAGADDYIIKPFERDDVRFRLSGLALRVMRSEALGDEASHLDPLELYRRDLRNFAHKPVPPA